MDYNIVKDVGQKIWSTFTIEKSLNIVETISQWKVPVSSKPVTALKLFPEATDG